MIYNDRFIYLMRDFNDDMALNVIRQLFILDNKSKNDIFLIINSDGGEIHALYAIHDAIKMLRSNVATICIGRAYSAAAYLLIAGTKGKRFITRYSDIMFHEIASDIEGSTSSIKDEIISLERYGNVMKQIVDENLNIPYKKVMKRRKDTYFTATEALSIGAVDHIITSIDDLSKYTNLKIN